MLKKFKDISDIPPTIFKEDVYLCNERGEVMTCRSRKQRSIKNVFSIISESDKRFIKESMVLPGFRPLFVVESTEGPIIFDLSLSTKFRLLIVIFPHFNRNEILTLVKGPLSVRTTLSQQIKEQLLAISDTELDETALLFAERLLSVRRSGEYYSLLFKTNLDVFREICDIAESFGRFYGCRFYLSYKDITEDIEPQNDFCFESCAFAMVSLAFLIRKYSSSRSANINVYLERLGFYFDITFDISEQYLYENLAESAPELKNLTERAYDHMFDCFCMQRDGQFIARAFLWLRAPDSADLKERKTKFIYDY